MCRSDCGLTSWSCPPPIDDRCVHGAGERVRREECAAAAGRLLGRARGPRTDWGLRALSLPAHTSPSHRYSGADTHGQTLKYTHTTNVHMLSSMAHNHVPFSGEVLKSDDNIWQDWKVENCITLSLDGTWLVPCSCHIRFAVNTSCRMCEMIVSYTIVIMVMKVTNMTCKKTSQILAMLTWSPHLQPCVYGWFYISKIILDYLSQHGRRTADIWMCLS